MTDKIIYDKEFTTKPYEDCEFECLWLDDDEEKIGLSVVDTKAPWSDETNIFEKGKTYKVKMTIEEVL